MRAALLDELLDSEIDLTCQAISANPGVRVWREGTDILVAFPADRRGASGLFSLDCARFDVDAPGVTMLDPVSRSELPLERWAPGVPHSIHPATGKPFVCMQGVAEYHSHPSHLDDHWDRYRCRFRIPQTVRRLLEKAGVGA